MAQSDARPKPLNEKGLGKGLVRMLASHLSCVASSAVGNLFEKVGARIDNMREDVIGAIEMLTLPFRKSLFVVCFILQTNINDFLVEL